MRQRLTLLILLILFLANAFTVGSIAWGSEKPTAIPIPKTDVFAPFLNENEKNSAACIIQNDNGTPMSVGIGFDSGMGMATYMDPSVCTNHPTYPFKITNVIFYLYHESTNWVWPVKIQVRIKNAIRADNCLGPDTLNTLYSQFFTIPADSSYDSLNYSPMNLTLNPPFCVYQPCFLEIDYLTPLKNPTDTLPGLLLDTDTLIVYTDSCLNWGFEGGNYYDKWHSFWRESPPGSVIIRASGYTNASECDTGWYWKADRVNAPSGMVDFDQNQPGWVSYCGPVSAANCLWWYGAVPVGWTPPQLADTLARYFHTTPASGTYADTMQIGLEQYFNHYGLPFQTQTYGMPYFHEMEESLKVSQDVILLLGQWEQVTADSFVRTGGHYVTMAGVWSESLKVALSDPDRDDAENGHPGRVRPPHAVHPSDHVLHNDPLYVSQDIYTSTETSPSPGNPHWGLTDYLLTKEMAESFEGKNFHPSQLKYYSPPPEGKGPSYIVVDYALMVCPKPSAVEDEDEPNVPKDFQLNQNYPNPFNPSTTIKFKVQSSKFKVPLPTTLKIYNILGQLVKTLVNEPKSAGEYEVVWDGKDERGNSLASGIYFYRLAIGANTETKRMLLLK